MRTLQWTAGTRVSRLESGILTVIAGLLLITVTTPLPGQVVNKVGTSAAVFLRIPVGARGAALGSANVARADDPSVIFWNPGGLSRLEGLQIAMDYSLWLPGLDFSFMGITMPLGQLGTLGLQVTRLGTEEMEITTPAFPMGTGQSYTAASTVLGLSYGRNLTDRFSIGASIKFLQERIFNSIANGIAFDVGTLFTTPFNGIRLGVSIANIGTKLQMDGEDLNIRVDVAPDQAGNNQSIVGGLRTDRFEAPLTLRIGTTGDIIKFQDVRLSWMADGFSPNDNAASMNVGTELALFQDSIFLRGGYNDLFLEDNIRGLTLGAGARISWSGGNYFTLDYAYQDFRYLGGVNRFTFNLRL